MEENYNFEGFKKLSDENEKLKKFLHENQRNLKEIFDMRKDYLLKSYCINNQNNQNDQIIQNLKNFHLLNWEDLNYKILSVIKLGELLEVFEENMKRIKQFFLIFNESTNGFQVFNDSEFEFQLNKIKNINEMKNLISNSFDFYY